MTNESPIEAPASSQNNKKTNSNKGKNKTRTPKSKGKDKSETPKATQPVKCDLCTSVFSNQGNYKRHRKIHTLNLKVHIHVIWFFFSWLCIYWLEPLISRYCSHSKRIEAELKPFDLQKVYIDFSFSLCSPGFTQQGHFACGSFSTPSLHHFSWPLTFTCDVQRLST